MVSPHTKYGSTTATKVRRPTSSPHCRASKVRRANAANKVLKVSVVNRAPKANMVNRVLPDRMALPLRKLPSC